MKQFWQQLTHRFTMHLLGMSAAEQTAWVADMLRREGTVLEVGIAQGELTREVYARYPALQVVGVDMSLAALQRNKAALEAAGIVNIQLVCARPQALPFAHDQFEQVVCLNLFQRVQHSMAVVDDLLRVAVDGASLVGTAVVEIKHEPRSLIYAGLRRLNKFYPVHVENLHELLGTTWSKLVGQRRGAIYAFRRPQLDRMTGELLVPQAAAQD